MRIQLPCRARLCESKLCVREGFPETTLNWLDQFTGYSPDRFPDNVFRRDRDEWAKRSAASMVGDSRGTPFQQRNLAGSSAHGPSFSRSIALTQHPCRASRRSVSYTHLRAHETRHDLV